MKSQQQAASDITDIQLERFTGEYASEKVAVQLLVKARSFQIDMTHWQEPFAQNIK